MGIPAAFRWLSSRYPKIISPVIEDQPLVMEDGSTIPVDTTRPNPNGEEFDNLYLDMNGIVHPCSHPEDRPAPKDEEEMMMEVFRYTDRVVNMVRPRKILMIAVGMIFLCLHYPYSTIVVLEKLIPILTHRHRRSCAQSQDESTTVETISFCTRSTRERARQAGAYKIAEATKQGKLDYRKLRDRNKEGFRFEFNHARYSFHGYPRAQFEVLVSV